MYSAIRRWTVVTASLLLTSLAPISGAAATETADWSEIHAVDVEALTRILLEQHPGSIDPRNADFRRRVLSAQTAALARSARVKTPAALAASLDAMMTDIGDAHSSVFGRIGEPSAGTSPPWQVGWRGMTPIVARSLPRATIRGAEILSCDGRTLSDWAQKDVLPWHSEFLNDTDLRPAMSEVLVNNGNPFRRYPTACRLKLKNGSEINHVLVWGESGPGAQASLLSRYSGDLASLRYLEDGSAWIRLPSFMPSPYNRLSDLQTRLRREYAQLTTAKTLIFDLRGNPGGVDRIMASTLAATVGNRPEIRRVLLTPQPTSIRLTSENAILLAERSRTSQPMLSATMAILASFLESGSSGSVAVEGLNKSSRPLLQVNIARHQPVGRQKVVAITDGICRSACLMFMSYLKEIPDLVHIGLPTPFEANYANPVQTELPSGLKLSYSTVIFETRFWPKEVYTPTLPLDFGPRGLAGQAFLTQTDTSDVTRATTSVWTTQATMREVLPLLGLKIPSDETQVDNPPRADIPAPN
jgi:hypothetical protein